MLSRRSFLMQVSGVVAVAEAFPRSLWAEDNPVRVLGKEGMIVRSARFLDLEMPMEDLKTWITPVPHFFVRNHMHEPSTLDPSTWALTISGEVENPLTLSLADLKKLQPHSVINTLECAGNGRALQQPHVPGVQWERGAVGTARNADAPFRRSTAISELRSGAEEINCPPCMCHVQPGYLRKF